MVRKEDIKEVKKVWGKEVWIVNCPQYCAKILMLDKRAMSSRHRHKNKQETFFALEGVASLTVGSESFILSPDSRPKTIFPGEVHSFWGASKAKILEVSTYHDDNDIERFSESKPSKQS